ncbi:MAG: TolC family protein [Sphingomonas sp.]
MRRIQVATAALACALASAPAAAQTTGEPSGIGAVPEGTPPPPVQTDPIPASPPLPQANGRVAPYPDVQPVAPAASPGTPSSAAAGDRNVTPTATVSGPQAPDANPPVYGPLIAPRAPRGDGKLDLVAAFEMGKDNDATYRGAIAEHDANRQVAGQTIAGYLPTAGYNYQNIPTEEGSRHVVTVTQPLISLSGLATLRQRGPRMRYADATFQVREQDLATRLMTAVTDIIKAREASTLNDARIDAFKVQSERADRMYRGGLGTVTDARDIEVRYELALANRALLKGDEIAAVARLRSITGIDPPADAFSLPKEFGPIELAPVDAYLAQQGQSNPQIAASRENERIGKLEAARVRGTFFPTVGASATYTRRGSVSTSYVGLSVNAPLSAGTFFQAGAANASARRSYEERRQTEEKARTELTRLYALVDGGRQALAINGKAIESAELSVAANAKSYEGGVRTNVDVINAIQTRFEVENTQVQSAATLATNYLNLLLLAGVPPEDALGAVQAFLLGR